jgi:peptidoglycan LD-endopeptidase CwlK
VDATQQQLLTLDRNFQPYAFDFINRARLELDLPAVVVAGGARRSAATQKRLVAAGRSTTLQSKHVKGLAFDVDMLGWNRDDVPWWVWQQLGDLAHEMGLVWGGDWSSFVDVGHFEI